MPKYSIIIPVFNRPQEIDELLHSLTEVNYSNFEVIIVEDGSHLSSEDICNGYSSKLKINYIFQENSGPGPARNKGAEIATGEILIFFDSDCLIPENYFEYVNKYFDNIDCYGGPDKAHESFNIIQKAINYSMTSILTTGGIRGGSKKMDKFYPRSFNLGIKREVFEKLNGFEKLRFGEDLDFSMRIQENGYKSKLIEEAWVYHKRRNNFKSFFKQVYNSGVARINLNYRHPGTIKFVHWLPTLFMSGNILGFITAAYLHSLIYILIIPLIIFFIDALIKTKQFIPAVLSIITSYTQLFGYGLGFIIAYIRRIILKKPEFSAFNKNFYK